MRNDGDLVVEALDLLRASGIGAPSGMVDALDAYCRLVREWNGVAGAVSTGDLARLEVHVADSLSLAPYVARFAGESGWVDVGSGGGFPAVPVKLAVPGAPVALVERSAKKAGFLRKVVGALGLEGVEVVVGEFPGVVEGWSAGVFTSRAVERPQKVLRAGSGWLEGDARWLWQGGDVPETLRGLFHVEHVEDGWSNRGLRRGSLEILTRRLDA